MKSYRIRGTATAPSPGMSLRLTASFTFFTRRHVRKNRGKSEALQCTSGRQLQRQRFEANPVLSPGTEETAWDSLIVDDTHVLVHEGRFWLYYKGGDFKVTADTSRKCVPLRPSSGTSRIAQAMSRWKRTALHRSLPRYGGPRARAIASGRSWCAHGLFETVGSVLRAVLSALKFFEGHCERLFDAGDHFLCGRILIGWQDVARRSRGVCWRRFLLEFHLQVGKLQRGGI
jgi:hypothetical protein